MVATTNQPVPTHTGWSRLVTIIVTIALILCSYLTIVQLNFGTAAKAFVFVREAKVLIHASEIIKAEVSDKLPDSIQNNLIQSAIAGKVLDIVVTPENLGKLAEPVLTAAYKVTEKAPTSLKDNKVELNTIQYKAQASQFISQWKLPDVISQPINQLISSTPDQIVIADGNKNPDNPIVLFAKVQQAAKTVNTVVMLLWWVIILGLIGLVALNFRQYRRLLHFGVWIFGFAGVFIVVGSYVLPPVLQLVIPQSTDPLIGSYVNALINDGTSYLFNATRSYGLFFVILALVLYLLKRFEVFALAYAWIQKMMKQRKSSHTHHTEHHTHHKK